MSTRDGAAQTGEGEGINTGDAPFRIAWSYATVDVSRTLVDD